MKVVKRKPYTVKTRTRYARLRFSNDSKMRENCFRFSYQGYCDCYDGSIRPMPEWAPVFNPSGVQYQCNLSNLLELCSWRISDDAAGEYKEVCCMISTTGSFYMYVEEASAFQCVVSAKKKMVAVPLMGKDKTQYALFTTSGYILVDMDRTYDTIIAHNTVAAGAYFRHRVFVGMKNGVVKYSAPEDFTNFTESVEEGGSIRFPDGGGEIIAMKVFDDALYIFFQCGIIRLDVGGDPCEFRAQKIRYSGGDIYTRTICVCDDSIYFLTRSGAYRVRGTKTESIPLDIIIPVKETGVEGCAVWKGMPVMRFRKVDGTSCTFAIRPDGSVYHLMDLPGLGQGENGKAMFLDSRKRLFYLAGDRQGSSWSYGNVMTEKHDLGYAGRKCVRKIRFYGEGGVSVSLMSGPRYWYKNLTFENGIAEWDLVAPGEEYVFSLDLERATYISEVYVEFEMLTKVKEAKR